MINMFCFQCQETCGNTGCTMTGVCGKTAACSNTMDALIHQLKIIALNKKVSHELAMFIAESLFMTVTNTNFNEKILLSQLRKAQKLTGAASFDAPSGVRSSDDEDVISLREFITYGLKGVCAYMVHAERLGAKDETLDDFIFYALKTVSEEKNIAKLTELLNETGSAAVKAMTLLDEAHTSHFGSQEPTLVSTSVGRNPGILVSGHDLKDLYELLIQTDGKDIDIYTHGEMLPAHAYVLFKKFSHLKGHYGSVWHRQNVEFASFNGPVLMTSNCITPVQESYCRRIFSTNCCHYPGITHIENDEKGMMKDFSPLIELALNCPPPSPISDNEYLIGFGHDALDEYFNQIVESIHSGDIKRFIIMAGCDGRQKIRSYYSDTAMLLPQDTIILTAGCAKYRYNSFSLGEINGIPRLIDAGQCNDSYSLAVFALKLKEAFEVDDINKLPISFDIAWYEQKAVAVLLALLSLGFRNIRLGPSLPAFVSPKILKFLVKNYKLKTITSVHEDIEMMMHGK